MISILSLNVLLVLCTGAPSVSISGPALRAASLGVAELKAISDSTVTTTVTSNDGGIVTTELHATALWKLLKAAGFDGGPSGKDVAPAKKHAGLRANVVVTASDGYVAVFSASELDPEIGAKDAMIAWQSDGKPLPATVGPFQLIVTSDRGKSRWVRNVVSIAVVPMAALPAATESPRP